MISSLVSFSKRDISADIPGMFVDRYNIPSAPDGSILHVEDSFYYKPDPVNNTHDRIDVSSEQLVRSIVHMHLTSQLGYRPDEHPALFCVINREVKLEDFKTDKELARLKALALSAQRKWFISLVKLADDDWQRYHSHHMVSDIQRTAARELGLKRDWVMSIPDEELPKVSGCPFCGMNLLNPEAPICPTCGKVHNPLKLAEIEARMSKKVQ